MEKTMDTELVKVLQYGLRTVDGTAGGYTATERREAIDKLNRCNIPMEQGEMQRLLTAELANPMES